MKRLDFASRFKVLTRQEHAPLTWQTRLFEDWFAKGNFPDVIDLPTGMGKTMVMAIWLIAREVSPKIPRRLIYVVDRRTVVDQATKEAEKLLQAVGKDKLAISTLRGQLADDRKWSCDPSRAAIIIGTVDLIGSALLFSGYRSSFKRRPLEAGLLGQDSLLVLDEAHLSKPFERLLVGRKREDGTCQKGIVQFQHGQGAPIKVIRMSATIGETPGEKIFSLDTDPTSSTYELQSEIDSSGNEKNEIVKRFTAKKLLTITTSNDVIESIATASSELATSHPGSRIVIFVKSPKEVEAVHKALIKKYKIRETQIAMLTGTMRGLERDELVIPPENDDQNKGRVMRRFLNPENDSSQGECFLISTSAGEVGFDLNADHLICDLAPLDSMIKRLGRVNRRGGEDRPAQIKMFADVPKANPKDGKPQPLPPFDAALKSTYELLRAVSNGDEIDVSPKALAEFRSNLLPDQLKAASTPDPTIVDLSDILLDNWSMTTITERMPGRPEVAPWLRGIADDQLQTTIAWRAELDLPGFDQLPLDEIEEWFDAHSIRTYETLGVPTTEAAKWFTNRWSKLSDVQKAEVGGRSMIVDRAGLRLITVKELVDELARKNSDSISLIRNAHLIVPASFGGIERGKGLLDADAPEVPKDEDQKTPEERQKAIAARRVAPDVADERGRYREFVVKSEDGVHEEHAIGSGSKPSKSKSCRLAVELASENDSHVRLVSYIPKYEKPETGTKKQTLAEHVQLVRKKIDEILGRLELPDAVKRAAQLAADFHDHGKNRDRWQRTVDGDATPPGEKWRDKTMGKSGGEMKRDPRGYRHEFGSLREFIDAFNAGHLLDENRQVITKDVFDLAMHLIAVHHGRGRPHFPKGGFDPDAESRTQEIHTDTIRRFAKLQRTYGHWHLAWLENLLRCADALASAETNPEDELDGEVE